MYLGVSINAEYTDSFNSHKHFFKKLPDLSFNS